MSHIRPLLSPAAVAEMLGISTVTLWRWRVEGDFPPPMCIGKRMKRWRPEVVEAYLESRVEKP